MAEVNPQPMALAAVPAGVRAALDEFGRFCDARGIPDPVRRRFMVALDEVLSNIVRHGRPEDGVMLVRVDLSGETLTVTVEDSSEAFNPLDGPAADTTSALEHRKAGGAGIAVVTGLLEDVRYERAGGRNRLIMADRLSRTTQQS